MESTLLKHDRWRALQDHLQTEGVKEVPPKLLQGPEPGSRQGVPLVAHYAAITHKSLGKITAAKWMALVLPFMVPFIVVPLGFIKWDVIVQQPFRIWLILTLVVGCTIAALTAWMRRNLLIGISERKGPLRVTLWELSMPLPDRNRHVRWRDVYSVSCSPERWRVPWQKLHLGIRVELNDGVVADLFVPSDDRDDLIGVMQALVLCHRKKPG